MRKQNIPGTVSPHSTWNVTSVESGLCLNRYNLTFIWNDTISSSQYYPKSGGAVPPVADADAIGALDRSTTNLSFHLWNFIVRSVFVRGCSCSRWCRWSGSTTLCQLLIRWLSKTKFKQMRIELKSKIYYRSQYAKIAPIDNNLSDEQTFNFNLLLLLLFRQDKPLKWQVVLQSWAD